MIGLSLRGGLQKVDLVAVTLAGLILVPYAVPRMAQRSTLAIEAAAVLVLTLGLLVSGLARQGWRGSVASIPWRQRAILGVVLYGAAAALGTAVGLVRGNESTLIAGQSFSMGMLPLGAAAAIAVAPRRMWRSLSIGVVAGVIASCLIQLANLVAKEAVGIPVPRLYLPSGVSITNQALIGLAMLLALRAGTGVRTKRILAAATVFLLVCIAWTGTRSLWLATPVAIVAYVAAVGIPRNFLTPRRIATAAAVTVGAALVLVLAMRYGAVEGAAMGEQAMSLTCNIGSTVGVEIQPAPPGIPAPYPVIAWRPTATPPRFTFSDPIPIVHQGRYGLMFWGEAGLDSGAYLALEWLDAHGRVLGEVRQDLTAKPPGRTYFLSGVTPEGTTTARLAGGSRVAAGAAARVRPMELRFLGRSPLRFAVSRQLAYLSYLVGSLKPALTLRTEAMDPSASYRLVESLKLAELFGKAPLWSKVLGHGLGARFAVNSYGYDSQGNRVLFENPNYIHNFYMFLLFKLGIVGSLLVLAALGIFVVDSFRLARQSPRGALRGFYGAAFAAWGSAAVFNVACPNLLEFLLAGVWGMLAAATALAAAGPAADSSAASESDKPG